MVSITLAIDELKSQLVEIVRGSLEKGFELVAGYAGSKIAKSVEGTLKDVAKAGAAAASGVTIVATGQVSLIGLREQIKGTRLSSPIHAPFTPRLICAHMCESC